jgi:hypothetical protein
VEDADEPVCEGSEGLVVGVAAGALSVIEGAGAGGIVECGEGLQKQCVAEATVAGEAGWDGQLRQRTLTGWMRHHPQRLRRGRGGQAVGVFVEGIDGQHAAQVRVFGEERSGTSWS